MKQPRCLKKCNPTYGQIDSNGLCELNVIFFVFVKENVIIITYAATDRGRRLTLSCYKWSFKILNWIVHKILLIHGEIWSKVGNSTSLLLADVFAKVAQVVNAEVLNIKSYQSRQKHCRRSAEALFSYITSAFYLPRQKTLKFESCCLWSGKMFTCKLSKYFAAVCLYI